MKSEYKRDLQNNYLILEISAEIEEDSYQMRMLEQNKIQGLLPFHSCRKDGLLQLNYEITSLQPLESMFEKKKMGYQDIVFLLSGIRNILEELQKYLLNPAQVLFAPSYIFLRPDRSSVNLCYIPGVYHETSIVPLAEFVLKRLEHDDGEAVKIGYGFYQESLKENFSLQELLKGIFLSPKDSGDKNNTEKSGDFTEVCSNIATHKNMEEYHIERTRAEQEAENEYEVVHKKRKDQAGCTEKFSDKVFSAIHPAVLLSGLLLTVMLEAVYYFGLLDVTEAGGIFFLIISVEALLNKYWHAIKDKKKKAENRWEEDRDEEMYRFLQEEMYEKTVEKEADQIEETCCLVRDDYERRIRFVCVQSGNKATQYPDIVIGKEPVYIGKMKGESDIFLNSPTVSRMHAMIIQNDQGCSVKDLNSRNGTFCNGERLRPQEQRTIQEGDIIAFAEIEYRRVSSFS